MGLRTWPSLPDVGPVRATSGVFRSGLVSGSSRDIQGAKNGSCEGGIWAASPKSGVFPDFTLRNPQSTRTCPTRSMALVPSPRPSTAARRRQSQPWCTVRP